MAESIAFARVGELACQRNPFLREIHARVVSCVPVALKKDLAGHRKTKHNINSGGEHPDPQQGYEVVLTDSVLFPEGGGQPCDHGVLIRRGGKEGEDAVPLCDAQRRGNTCVFSTHFPLEVGEEVLMRVDWERRLDHMQHHSAQHLLSAIVENSSYCGLPTVSWSLSHPHCHIVLPTGDKIDPSMVNCIEAACNQAIANAVPVRCDAYPSREAYERTMEDDQEAKEENKRRQSGKIPADVTGPIRIITIADGIDSCLCCGTHVTNLAQLQMLKLLHQETKGDTLKLFFIAGDRVRQYCGKVYSRERELMKELGGVRPDGFVSAVVRRGKEYAAMEKRLKTLTIDLAKLEGEKLIAKVNESKGGRDDAAVGGSSTIIAYRRDDVDADFFIALSDTLRPGCPECVAVLAWASPAPTTTTTTNTNDPQHPPNTAPKPGQFMVVGPVECVEEVASSVCAALEGKGGMSKYGYRGKCNLVGWDELAKALNRRCCR